MLSTSRALVAADKLNVRRSPMEASIPSTGPSTTWIRAFAVFGALVTGALLYLGAIWPSVFTIAALIAIPSPILFALTVIWPGTLWKRRLVRWYLLGCSATAVISFSVESIWLWKSARTPCVYEVPKGYTGWVVVEYERAGAAPIPIENGKRIFRFGNDGSLVTSSKCEDGWATDEYYALGSSRERLPMTGWGGGGLIWGGSNGQIQVGKNMPRRYENFFVGTEKDYKAAKAGPRVPQ